MPQTASPLALAIVAMTIALATPRALGQPPRGTLDRLKAGGMLRLGYRVDARPLSFKEQDGRAAGFSVMLCQSIADEVKREPGLAGVRVDWVPASTDGRFTDIEQGQIDLLCGAATVSIERRARVSFSIPIFAGGIGAVVRADAADHLRAVLAGQAQTFQPVWEEAARQVLDGRAFAAVATTTADTWLTARLREAGVKANVVRTTTYDAAVQALVDRKADAVFGERAILLDAVRRHPSAAELQFVDRFFTFEPLALALPRGDEDLRLIVDRTLSRLYRSGDVNAVYAGWFGQPDPITLDFYRAIAIPQ